MTEEFANAAFNASIALREFHISMAVSQFNSHSSRSELDYHDRKALAYFQRWNDRDGWLNYLKLSA